MSLFNCIMSHETPTTRIDVYLPAGLSSERVPGPIERFLTAPLRRAHERLSA